MCAGDRAAFGNDPFEGFVVFFIVSCYEKGPFGIILFENVQDLFCVFGRSVVKSEVNDLPLVGVVLFYSDGAHSRTGIS